MHSFPTLYRGSRIFSPNESRNLERRENAVMQIRYRSRPKTAAQRSCNALEALHRHEAVGNSPRMSQVESRGLRKFLLAMPRLARGHTHDLDAPVPQDAHPQPLWLPLLQQYYLLLKSLDPSSTNASSDMWASQLVRRTGTLRSSLVVVSTRISDLV